MKNGRDSVGSAGRGRNRVGRWLALGAVGILLAFVAPFAVIQILIRSNAIPAELEESPKQLLAASGVLHPAPPATRRAASRRNGPESDPPKTFEEYVRAQLKANPDDQGAALYFEVVDEFRKGNANDAWGWGKALLAERDSSGKITGKPDWKPGDPLTQEQAAWLAAHEDFIDKLRRMIAAGGPPQVSREEILARDPLKGYADPFPEFSFFQSAARILGADAQRVGAAGDPDGAAGRIADIYRFAGMTGVRSIIPVLVGFSIQSAADRTLAAWLSGGSIPADAARRLSSILDANRIPAQATAGAIAMESIMTRGADVELMKKPLGEAIQALGQLTYRWSSVDGGNLLPSLIHQPARTIDAIASIAWMKANAAGDLRDYDGFMDRYLPILDGPYSGIKGFDFNHEIESISPRSAFRVATPSLTEAVVRGYVSEARTNMNRAALRMLAGESPPDNAGPSAPGWAQSPWRDPFTEEPLRIVDDGDSTYIYSLGADLKDQGGEVEYDPTGGATSEGDQTLRIPRMPAQERK